MIHDFRKPSVHMWLEYEITAEVFQSVHHILRCVALRQKHLLSLFTLFFQFVMSDLTLGSPPAFFFSLHLLIPLGRGPGRRLLYPDSKDVHGGFFRLSGEFQVNEVCHLYKQWGCLLPPVSPVPRVACPRVLSTAGSTTLFPVLPPLLLTCSVYVSVIPPVATCWALPVALLYAQVGYAGQGLHGKHGRALAHAGQH